MSIPYCFGVAEEEPGGGAGGSGGSGGSGATGAGATGGGAGGVGVGGTTELVTSGVAGAGGGVSAGRGASASALTASICRVSDPVTSSMCRSTAARRVLSCSFSALKPRKVFASFRVSACASKGGGAGWPRKVAITAANRCEPTSLRDVSTASKSAEAAVTPHNAARHNCRLSKGFLAAARLGVAFVSCFLTATLRSAR
jgi:hypothetical protein